MPTFHINMHLICIVHMYLRECVSSRTCPTLSGRSAGSKSNSKCARDRAAAKKEQGEEINATTCVATAEQSDTPQAGYVPRHEPQAMWPDASTIAAHKSLKLIS